MRWLCVRAIWSLTSNPSLTESQDWEASNYLSQPGFEPSGVPCQAELPSLAALSWGIALGVPQIHVAEPCSWLKPESLKAGGQTPFLQETPRIGLSFAARVTYPVSEIPCSLHRKQKKISNSGFINELKCQMFVLWMFQMSFISRRKEATMSSQEKKIALSTSISGLPTPFQFPIYFPVKCHSSLVLQA